MSRLDEIRSAIEANQHPFTLDDQGPVRFAYNPVGGRIRCTSRVTREHGIVILGRAPGSVHRLPYFFASNAQTDTELTPTSVAERSRWLLHVGDDGTVNLRPGAEVFWEDYQQDIVDPFKK